MIGMIVMLLLFLGANWVQAKWNSYQTDATYGMPRTYQVDQVVGHQDSPAHPTHFIFENLGGHCFFIELPGGQVALARLFDGPTLVGSDAASWPVTAKFQDVKGDGKIDVIMVVHSEEVLYLNDGTTFKNQTQQ